MVDAPTEKPTNFPGITTAEGATTRPDPAFYSRAQCASIDPVTKLQCRRDFDNGFHNCHDAIGADGKVVDWMEDMPRPAASDVPTAPASDKERIDEIAHAIYGSSLAASPATAPAPENTQIRCPKGCGKWVYLGEPHSCHYVGPAFIPEPPATAPSTPTKKLLDSYGFYSRELGRLMQVQRDEEIATMRETESRKKVDAAVAQLESDIAKMQAAFVNALEDNARLTRERREFRDVAREAMRLCANPSRKNGLAILQATLDAMHRDSFDELQGEIRV